jgi:hypothetical protein
MNAFEIYTKSVGDDDYKGGGVSDDDVIHAGYDISRILGGEGQSGGSVSDSNIRGEYIPLGLYFHQVVQTMIDPTFMKATVIDDVLFNSFFSKDKKERSRKRIPKLQFKKTLKQPAKHTIDI